MPGVRLVADGRPVAALNLLSENTSMPFSSCDQARSRCQCPSWFRTRRRLSPRRPPCCRCRPQRPPCFWNRRSCRRSSREIEVAQPPIAIVSSASSATSALLVAPRESCQSSVRGRIDAASDLQELDNDVRPYLSQFLTKFSFVKRFYLSVFRQILNGLKIYLLFACVLFDGTA